MCIYNSRSSKNVYTFTNPQWYWSINCQNILHLVSVTTCIRLSQCLHFFMYPTLSLYTWLTSACKLWMIVLQYYDFTCHLISLFKQCHWRGFRLNAIPQLMNTSPVQRPNQSIWTFFPFKCDICKFNGLSVKCRTLYKVLWLPVHGH